MSLTPADLLEIRNIVEDIVSPLKGEIIALRNDVKEICELLPTD
jgi:hypothetical protein